MDVHDIDDPAEVIAAAQRHRAAVGSLTDRVARTLDALVLPRAPESRFDRELAARLDWITEALARAAAGNAARADATHRAAVHTLSVLDDADRTGAQHIRRSESA